MKTKAIVTALLLASPSFALAELTIADLQPDTQVTITGVVDRIADEDTFILRDPSGEIEVYLGPNLVPVSVGADVTVTGLVDDGPVPEIYARTVTTSDGEVFTFSYNYD